MAINDPYDRSGQYAGGDRGPKLDAYSPLSPDRRDYGIATMVGDGGKDSRKGYGGILDTIENRIGALDQFGGKGPYGYYGQGLDDDHTLEGVVTATNRNGSHQFSNWSDKNRSAYGTTQRALNGTPKPNEQGWYDQALEVYDDYYGNPQSGYRGSALGGTYYQNDASLTKQQAGFQARMQNDYGAMPIGDGYHVVTGPGYYGDGLQAYDPIPNTPTYDMPQPMQPTRSFGLADMLAEDPMAPSAYAPGVAPGFDDPMQPEAYAPAPAFDDPMAPEAYGPPTGNAAALGAALAQPDPVPVEQQPASDPGWGGSDGWAGYSTGDTAVADAIAGLDASSFDGFGPDAGFGPADGLGPDDGFGGEYSDDDPSGGWW